MTTEEDEVTKVKLGTLKPTAIQVRALDSPGLTPAALKGAISDLRCRAGDLTNLKYKQVGELVQS